MKKYKPKQLLLLLIFTFTLIILLFPLNSKGISDLTFTFDQDILYSETEPNFFVDKLSNAKNSSEYTQHYNGTYSFENEIDGTNSSNIDFIDSDNSGADTLISIISELDGHSKVIDFHDFGGSRVFGVNTFDIETITGTIEFWIRTTDISKLNRIIIQNQVGASAIEFHINNNDFVYINGGTNVINGIKPLDDIWYRITFIFSCITDDYDIWINDIERESGVSFISLSDTLKAFAILSDSPDSNYHIYFDGIGYNWINFFVSNDFVYEFEEFTLGQEFESLAPIYTDWNYVRGVDTIATIENIAPFDNQYLQLLDNSAVDFPLINIPFGYQSISNTTNLYFKVNESTGSDTFFMYKEGVNSKFLITIIGDSLYYDTGEPARADILDDTWYQLTVSFNCISDTVSIYLNNELIVDNEAFYLSVADYIDNIELSTVINNVVVSGFDNITLSGSISGYSINDNLIPYLQVNESIVEVDRFEFAYSSFETLYAVGSDIFSGWNETDTDSDLVNIGANDLWNSDRVVSITHFAPVDDTLGLNRTFNQHGNILNITWSIEFQDFEVASEYEMKIYSYDNTLISDIFFENGHLKYNDITPLETILKSGLTDNEIYSMNLYINYYDNISILRLSIDDTPTNSYIIPLIPSTVKEGLGIIITQIEGSVAQDMDVDIDYIGVYINGTSLSTEFAHLRINDFLPFEAYWNFNEFNLVDFHILGNSSIWISEGKPYLLGISQLIEITSNDIYDSIDFTNTHGRILFTITPVIIQDPSIWFQFYNQFEFFSINIEGVKLKEGINEYPLIESIEGVNNNNSFFRAVDNRLTFTHISNDNNLEFIQAKFDIIDISTDGYTVSFRSEIIGQAFGYYRLNFTSISNIVPFPLIMSTTRFIPTQNQTLNSIIILITDRDINTISGLTTGYITDIEFIVSADVGVSIIITALIFMMIPLIIILIPSISISQVYGKMLLIPLFLLMSIICVATGIIPLWLFFIIGFSSTMFVLKAKETEGID